MFCWLCRKMLGPKNAFQVPRNVTRQNAARARVDQLHAHLDTMTPLELGQDSLVGGHVRHRERGQRQLRAPGGGLLAPAIAHKTTRRIYPRTTIPHLERSGEPFALPPQLYGVR
jgi:hypothetical protein